jgi:hypothetical protein
MIGTIFQFGSEMVEVRIDRTDCLFRTKDYGGAFSPIDGLKLEKTGVIKEFPELKDNDAWRKIAIERFKEKIKNYETERQRMEYVKEDLKKYGYIPLYEQEKGKRPKKL